MNEDTLLNPDLIEALILRERAISSMAANRKTPAPVPKSSSTRNPTVVKLLANFRRRVEEENGKCFRTEVRDTGVFICGLHHTSIWAEGVDTCPQLSALLDIFESVVAKEISLLEADLDAQKSSTDSRRWPTPDQPTGSWHGDPDVTRVNFWDNLMDEDEDEKPE